MQPDIQLYMYCMPAAVHVCYVLNPALVTSGVLCTSKHAASHGNIARFTPSSATLCAAGSVVATDLINLQEGHSERSAFGQLCQPSPTQPDAQLYETAAAAATTL
jgi:hypothetical protein